MPIIDILFYNFHIASVNVMVSGFGVIFCGGEHKPGTNNNKESAIKDHAETTDHDIDTGYVEIIEKNVNNWHKRIFLESWHSTIDKNAVNERKPFPSVYKTLLKP